MYRCCTRLEPSHKIRITRMGGDGGTVSTNRLYLRGAGRATHTADAQRHSTTSTTEDERERLRQIMTTCSVTGQPLDLSSRDIVCARTVGSITGRLPSRPCSGGKRPRLLPPRPRRPVAITMGAATKDRSPIWVGT